jgi:hypothetical protein
LERLVLACLEKDPDRRPQNGEVLWEMLLEYEKHENWSRAAARRWWEVHLPELTSPLVLAVPSTGGAPWSQPRSFQRLVGEVFQSDA